ncbi:MAG: hypoxanthine phosphoribosyltransferase [Chloroherpetonaceae bacterium]|nr:hypoxanthine phosphoribosyltransferase [Chloroherpetonaceae bacterium]MDW8438154.1 hypoxanthine phosphoribosyltransferase [Chloroherpetonaceae bacterium]
MIPRKDTHKCLGDFLSSLKISNIRPFKLHRALNADHQPVFVDNEKFVVAITESEIQRRVQELGRDIERDYAGKTPILIGLLNGAFIFIADLCRAIAAIDVEVDFYKLSSYGDAKISSGDVKLLKGIDADIKGRHVIVVDDVVDSGLSMKFIRDALLQREPASLKFCALLFKEGVSELDFKIDYVGFAIPKHFVIGYGLDYKQKKRNLKCVYRLSA